jgi:hypothetical protein
MQRTPFIILATITAALTAMVIFLFLDRNREAIVEKPVTESMTFVEGMNYAMPVEMPDSIDFCGESVPLEIFYVREQLERELTVNTYWHSSTLLLLKRTGRWLPVIRPILSRNGIPDDFAYLAMVESGLMNVVSPSGAAGYWQFLDKTAREYGLVVNKEVDERYHVAQATEAACRYLSKSYAKFGNWTLVAASYNAGQGRIDDHVDDQFTRNFYAMHLNEETSRYIYRILAMKQIFKDPSKYGFKLQPGDYYDTLSTRKILITETISNLPAFAGKHQTSYRMLKELNPWLRSDKLTVRRGEEYILLLPAS